MILWPSILNNNKTLLWRAATARALFSLMNGRAVFIPHQKLNLKRLIFLGPYLNMFSLHVYDQLRIHGEY